MVPVTNVAGIQSQRETHPLEEEPMIWSKKRKSVYFCSRLIKNAV